MLSADSSALKSESDDQSRPTAPMIPSAAALSCTWWTSLTMLSSEVPGKACFSSRTRKPDASARCARPRSESARKTSGTNDSSAKYATIAARWVPRSAKNLSTSWRSPMRTDQSLHLGPASVSAVEPARALADLVEISPQIEAAAVMAGDGEVLGSVGVPDGRAGILARTARELLTGAASFRSDDRRVTQLHA